MKRLSKVVVLMVVVTLIGSTGCKRQLGKKTVAAPHKTVAVKQTVEAYGIIKAREYKDINLDFPAQIVKVPVKDGQHVKLGEALIYLNIDDFKALIKSKENELNNARFDLLKQQKTLRDAQEAYERALRNLQDKEKLLREGALSQKEVDDYRDVVLEKERAVTDIKVSLNQAAGLTGLSVLTEKVRVLEYDLARMRKKLDQSFLKGNIIVSDF
ncbi:MAG TPA: biotin/lipoyl-binding protein, partial [Bacillota bacterium]|nr:biotin/lipoyl-binding protein [Bacillota bacterium]